MREQARGYRAAADYYPADVKDTQEFVDLIEGLWDTGAHQVDGLCDARTGAFLNPRLAQPSLHFSTHPDDWKLVPISIQHDEEKYGLPRLDIALEYFPMVQGIDEPEGFSKALKKLGSRAQKDWAKTKRLLAATTRAHGLDFKKWEPAGPNFFSVRVNDEVRAHLQWLGGKWLAREIGHHDQMGH